MHHTVIFKWHLDILYFIFTSRYSLLFAFKNKNCSNRPAERFLLPPTPENHFNTFYKLMCLENVHSLMEVQYFLSNGRLPFAQGTDTALLNNAFIPSLKKSFPEEFSVWTFSVTFF